MKLTTINERCLRDIRKILFDRIEQMNLETPTVILKENHIKNIMALEKVFDTAWEVMQDELYE